MLRRDEEFRRFDIADGILGQLGNVERAGRASNNRTRMKWPFEQERRRAKSEEAAVDTKRPAGAAAKLGEV